MRALERGLSLLAALNAAGRADPSGLAHKTGIDRTTTYRLLATLESLGYVTKSPSDGQYVLTPAVRDLSEGLTETDRAARVVCEELFDLLGQVTWPTDFATFDSGWMVIRETTHRLSPYSVHRAMVGRRRALLDTAMGRAVLAGASESRRQEMLEIALLHGTIPGDRAMLADRMATLQADFADRGYAWAVGGADPRISAIALPLQGATHVLGSINVLFFTTAMTVETAAERYLPSLSATVARIEERLRVQGLTV
ncbi:DNA-binding transcriptional activator MhpR [Novosphingobium nitrogenifigens DSM 19370]|uniref:DNA-binding transcriptional activator MhpR n=1 Tax=Novosphingobium nitrogenifigens DSM 19370 TaxID=983920 RepID=F1ZC19_9SPHN|nr:DNA-binding transcriptional activator MhpR [Novosphingobium nitrogenifigens DSM 19370]